MTIGIFETGSIKRPRMVISTSTSTSLDCAVLRGWALLLFASYTTNSPTRLLGKLAVALTGTYVPILGADVSGAVKFRVLFWLVRPIHWLRDSLRPSTITSEIVPMY